MICHRCKREIKGTMAYIAVRGDIVLRAPNKRPNVFTCREQMDNYAQNLFMHDICWIGTLKEHGVKLFDMNEAAEKYRKKEIPDGLGQDKT